VSCVTFIARGATSDNRVHDSRANKRATFLDDERFGRPSKGALPTSTALPDVYQVGGKPSQQRLPMASHARRNDWRGH